MEVDSVSATRLCPPNRKVIKALSYLEVLTADSTSVIGAPDGTDRPVDAKSPSGKIHALEKQLALVSSSGFENPDMLALLNKQLAEAKAAHTAATAESVPLTEDKHTELKLAFQRYNTWASTSLAARSLELDKEIADLQSQKQQVVAEQAEVVGFYANAMTLLGNAAKAANMPTHVAAAVAPPAEPVQLSMPPAGLADAVQKELVNAKEGLALRLQFETQGQELSHDQMVFHALDMAFGLAASSAVGHIAALTQAQAPPANSPAAAVPTPAPAVPAGMQRASAIGLA